MTNRPVVAPAAFDRTQFEGDLPSGWDAEIYRNGELLAFAKPTGRINAICLKMCGFSTVKTESRSSFMGPRGKSARARS